MSHTLGALRRIPVHRATLVAVVFCVAWIAIVAPRATGDGGKWAAVQAPLTKVTEMATLLSYSDIVDGHAIHRENIPTIRGVAMLEGAPVAADFYHVRVIYNFLAALIAPFIGMLTSFLLLNLLCWAGTTYMSWRLTRSLTGDPITAALSAALTVGALGFVIHVSDYSAHLLGATIYVGGIVALCESGLWQRRRRLALHMSFGVIIAIAGLTNNAGIMLAIVYALVAWRHNRLRDIGGALAIGLSAVPMWTRILDLIATRPAPHVEGTYLALSLHRWIDLLAASPGQFIVLGLKSLAENLTIDAPPILPLGLAACLLATPLAGKRRFILTAILVPIASLIPWRNITTGDVAYTILGIVPLLHVAIAAWIAPWLRGPRAVFGGMAALALLIVQFGWSTGPLWGWHLPVLAYFYGPFDIAGLWTAAPTIVSLTGAEPTPHLFGGDATLIEAGLATVPQPMVSAAFNPFASLIAKTFPALYFVALILILMQRGPARRQLLIGFATLFVGSSLAGPILDVQPPSYSLNAWTGIRLDRGRSLTYRIAVAPDFVRRLAASAPDVTMQIYLGLSDRQSDFALIAGPNRLTPLDDRFFPERGHLVTLDRTALIDGLAKNDVFEVTAVASAQVTALGWQRSILTGRTLTPPGPVLPVVELRAVSPDGTLLLDGF